jgi:hypothetical protein
MFNRIISDRNMKTAKLFCVCALTIMFVAPGLVGAQAPGIDPKATEILRHMTDYLAGLHQFSAESQNTLEAVLTSGQKIEFEAAASLVLQRPDKLRMMRKGDIVDQVFYYDGKTLTLYNPKENLYATVAAPDTVDKMMDFARGTLDLFAPAGDLFYRDTYERLMQDVTSGFVVGKATIGGVLCDQLAFSGPEVDWQIWIEQGDKPLPRKYVITTKLVEGWPDYTVSIFNWNIAPPIADGEFSFVPPAGAEKIDFLPLAGNRAPN